MELPLSKPVVDVQMEDNSTTDESFNQQGSTVNIGAGATYNQNCGNQKREFTRWESTLIIAILILFGFGYMIFHLNSSVIQFKNESIETHNTMQNEYRNLIEKSNKAHDQILQKAKEGTVWLLRDDIMKTIDYHSSTKVITMKQFKCIKDEFEYYTSIGGNHDVKEKYDNFVAKIFGIGEIKMVAEDQVEKR